MANDLGKYAAHEYTDWIAEHVEPWTYLKFPYLKKVGWKGFVDGNDSGVYCATPLSRLNAADGMATPLAQAEYEKFYEHPGWKTGSPETGDPLGKVDRAALCGGALG
jgi:F420-non-reducing hydrogenase large subunit